MSEHEDIDEIHDLRAQASQASDDRAYWFSKHEEVQAKLAAAENSLIIERAKPDNTRKLLEERDIWMNREAGLTRQVVHLLKQRDELREELQSMLDLVVAHSPNLATDLGTLTGRFVQGALRVLEETKP